MAPSWDGALTLYWPVPAGLTGVVAMQRRVSQSGTYWKRPAVSDGSPVVGPWEWRARLVSGLPPRGSPVEISWHLNGTNLPAASGSVLTLADVQPAQAGRYSVTVSNHLVDQQWRCSFLPWLAFSSQISPRPRDFLGGRRSSVQGPGRTSAEFSMQKDGIDLADATNSRWF